jgi:hypothetical protein
MEFVDCADAVGKFDQMLKSSLGSLYQELVLNDCYVREHEVVNLFVFGHLVPAFVRETLDLRQIGIEYPVQKIKATKTAKERARKDLVVWPKCGATLWNQHYPLAVVEWKHISRLTKYPNKSRREHEQDIGWLVENQDLMQVGYAVIVEHTAATLSLSCTRVQGQTLNRNFCILPKASAAAL